MTVPYGDEHGFPDLIIPFDVWKKQITPTEDDGGLLCPSCICKRLTAAGIRCVGAFVSGPIESVSAVTMNAIRRIENIELAIEGRDNRLGVALRAKPSANVAASLMSCVDHRRGTAEDDDGELHELHICRTCGAVCDGDSPCRVIEVVP